MELRVLVCRYYCELPQLTVTEPVHCTTIPNTGPYRVTFLLYEPPSVTLKPASCYDYISQTIHKTK